MDVRCNYPTSNIQYPTFSHRILPFARFMRSVTLTPQEFNSFVARDNNPPITRLELELWFSLDGLDDQRH